MTDKTAASKTSPTSSITGETNVQSIGERLIMRLPAEASRSMPSRGQVAANARINGHNYTAVLEPDGVKGHWLAVDSTLRETLGLADGDPVRFELEPTKAWPEPALPQDFQEALTTSAGSAALWKAITPMARWEWVRWINATKNPGTRERRIKVAASKLLAGKRRPCCFDLSSCTDPELSKNGKLIDTQ